MNERDLLTAQALTALDEARKDAMRLAEMQHETLDRLITARYDRPVNPRREARPAQSPMSIDPSLDGDDTNFLKSMGVSAPPEEAV